jgi:hypothetical protein
MLKGDPCVRSTWRGSAYKADENCPADYPYIRRQQTLKGIGLRSFADAFVMQIETNLLWISLV